MLIKDGSVESRPNWQVNARVGYRKNDWEVAVDCLNLLGCDDNDIEYFYPSRLPGEPAAGVDDVHLHPAEPRTGEFDAEVLMSQPFAVIRIGSRRAVAGSLRH